MANDYYTPVNTSVITPDSRFGATFLSTKYRDRAVGGEVLMDKTSGELYVKRSSDGKIVSFYQNRKSINDLMLDLRVLLSNNKSFQYPSKVNDAYYVSTNYDLIAINNEVLFNLLTDNVNISGGPNDINRFTFKVSGNSNGFFCHLASRDIDKAVIESLTSLYNLKIKTYDGTDQSYLTEKDKFGTITSWESSNASIIYDIITYKNGHSESYSDITDYIRMNESSAIIFPDEIYTVDKSFDYLQVTIKSIHFDKLHFMVNHIMDFTDVSDTYNILISPDHRIELGECHIMNFIDSFDYLENHGNETIVSLVDVPRFNLYMQTFKDSSATSIMISTTRPEESEWDDESIWAERVRDVSAGGVITQTSSPSSFFDLEEYFSSSNNQTITSHDLEFEGSMNADSTDFIILQTTD